MEELWYTDDASAANEVRGLRVHQAGWQDVKVVGHAIDDDSVTSIVAASGARGDGKFA